MKKHEKKYCSKTLLIGMMLLGIVQAGFSQGKASLGIGDQAPALKYSKWIKGTPVNSFDADRFYVVEFWATWCGPCKAAMPHLSALAKKYKDNATFIGMNIWEKTGAEPYELSLPEVIKYVNSVGDNMDYNVAADNNEKDMVNNWMLPAGQIGIPATFLIKDSKIIWIGHPMGVDSIINAAITGKYDMEAFKEKYKKSRVRAEATMAKLKILEPITKAYNAKEYDKALELVEGLDENDDMLKLQKRYYKYSILLGQKKEAEAIAFGENWVKENKNMGQSVAMGILANDGLSKKSYLYAVSLYKQLLSGEGTVTPLVYNGIAAAYDKAGDLSSAIASQELAIKDAKKALADKKFIGSVSEDTVIQFEKKLKEYKSRK